MGKLVNPVVKAAAEEIYNNSLSVEQIAKTITEYLHKTWLMGDWKKKEHRWEVCSMCGPMVVCGNCGNNCCNGASGKTGSQSIDCDCDDAYDMQDLREVPQVVLDYWNYLENIT